MSESDSAPDVWKTPASPDIRYLAIVHDEVWTQMVTYWMQRGVDIVRIPDQFAGGTEQEAYYVLSPRSLGDS